MVEESKQKQIEKRDSKYEPMINGPALLDPNGPGSANNDINEGNDSLIKTTNNTTKTSEDNNDDGDDNGGGDYVLPGKVTDGNSTIEHGQSGLLP